MKGKLVLAAVALVSLSVAVFAADADYEKAGAWEFSFERGHKSAHNVSTIAHSNEWAVLLVGCGETGVLGARVAFSQRKLQSQKVTYQIDDGPEVTSTWVVSSVNPNDRTGVNLTDARTFVRFLPKSGKLRVRLDTQGGASEATFDLNGIDAVRRAGDDVCKF
jgi:hypothetical protein